MSTRPRISHLMHHKHMAKMTSLRPDVTRSGPVRFGSGTSELGGLLPGSRQNSGLNISYMSQYITPLSYVFCWLRFCHLRLQVTHSSFLRCVLTPSEPQPGEEERTSVTLAASPALTTEKKDLSPEPGWQGKTAKLQCSVGTPLKPSCAHEGRCGARGLISDFSEDLQGGHLKARPSGEGEDAKEKWEERNRNEGADRTTPRLKAERRQRLYNKAEQVTPPLKLIPCGFP